MYHILPLMYLVTKKNPKPLVRRMIIKLIKQGSIHVDFFIKNETTLLVRSTKNHFLFLQPALFSHPHIEITGENHTGELNSWV